MTFIRRLWQGLTSLSQIEDDLLMMLHSNEQIFLEHVDELVSFTTKKIVLRSKLGTIKIYGENLCISLMHEDELLLQGIMTDVQFIPEKRESE